MGDDIDCCRRPTNLGKKDLKTYRGINQKNNPKLPFSNIDGTDNFDSFKQPKNLEKKSNKKGNAFLNSIYGNENESKFPNFSEFDIEPVSEPLYQEPISSTQYGNPQYIDSNPVITQQNQIIQDNNVINSTEQFTQPQTQITQIQNQFQTGFDISNYDKTIQNNYITSNIEDYTNNANNVNITSQPIEYINSTTNENVTNITSQQYDNYQKVLPTKYIQIQKPVIYANNIPNQTDITKYIESSSNIQQYQQFHISNIPSNNYIEENSIPISTTSPQYYESNNDINYLPPKIEAVYNSPPIYTGEIPTSQTSEIQYSNNPQEISINEQNQQIYYSQKPQQIYLEPQSQIDNNEYVQQKKGPSDSGHKKSKKLKKRRKIIEYYIEDDDDDEEEEENDEEEEPSSSIYDQIKEQKFKNKNKKVIVKFIKKNRHNIDEEDTKVKKNHKNKKQNIKLLEDKENESDNMEHERNLNQKQIKVLENNQKIKEVENIEEIKESERDEEEFSGFQKEPEMIRESLENSDNNFDDIFENRIKNINNNINNKNNEKKIISLKDGSKIVGNFKQEEILDKDEMAEKERNELFSGKTLKVANVEKKEESTFCQVPGFISNIFSKIF